MTLGPLESLGWALQFGVLALLMAGLATPPRLPRASLSSALLVVALGWVWRQSYLFALASGGFVFWVGDDALRWMRAFQWSRDPFLVIADDPWIGGAYYLHGAAMWLLGEPLHATRLVASVTNGLPLLGVFLFSRALFRDFAFAAFCAAFVAPWWIHVLLGSGTMTEMPVVGLLLAGGASTLHALRAPAAGPRRRLLALGGVLFALATALHLVAWIQVAAVELCLLLHLARRGDLPWPGRLMEWLAAALPAASFALLWLGAVWIEAGTPFAGIASQAGDVSIFRIAGAAAPDPLLALSVYPTSLLFSLLPVLPLVAFGVVHPFLARRQVDPRVRGVLWVLAAALGALMVTALFAGTNVTPFRSVAPLAAALVPFAWAPVFLAARDESAGDATGPARRRLPVMLLAAAVLLVHVVDNHRKIFAYRVAVDAVTPTAPELREPGLTLPSTEADTYALGAWLRREALIRQYLRDENWEHPIRVLIPGGQWFWFKWLKLEYAVGNPEWLEPLERPIHHDPDPERVVETLAPHQVLIADREIASPWLRRITRIGHYRVYARREQAAGRR